jgi:hypothetical protein
MKSCVGPVTRGRLSRTTSGSLANSLPHKALAETQGTGGMLYFQSNADKDFVFNLRLSAAGIFSLLLRE